MPIGEAKTSVVDKKKSLRGAMFIIFILYVPSTYLVILGDGAPHSTTLSNSSYTDYSITLSPFGQNARSETDSCCEAELANPN